MPEEKETSEQDFIATARKRFEHASDDEKPLRDEALIDLKYVAGDQWDPKLKQQREQAGRPALTFPRCHTFVQQVSNEARQNKPQIKFAPGDDQADKDTADVYEGLARHIQYSSDAQIAYETSVEYSAGGSFGYYRFLTEEDDDDEQEIKIMPVLDPFAIYGVLVPACFNREPMYAFVIEDVPREEFEDAYPKSAISLDAGFDQGGISAGWIGTDTVRVAEYWHCKEVKSENKSGTRKKRQLQVKFTKMTWAEKIEGSETDWLGYCIPIIPVLGKLMIIQGKPQLTSVVRFQRGPQQMINYTKTRIAETLAISPVSPYMVAQGQIPKGDKKWENLNTQVYPYLEYLPVDSAGKPAPPPQRNVSEPPIQAYAEFAAQEIDDMKATSGIFDASMGAKSNETSGTAIARRQQQSNMTTMHYMDNLERAFKKGGKILEDLIPKIYDTERMIQTLGSDEAPKIVKVNAPYEVSPGKVKHHKMTGKYNVIVTMGRAFSTKRMESFDMFSQIIQGNPQLLPMIGDIMFRNSDSAGADQLADRFEKMLPPNLQPNNDDPEQQAQQLQAQLGQTQQHLQAINAYAQQLEKEKEGKVVENQARMQIEQFKAQKEYDLKVLDLQVKREMAEIEAKIQDLSERRRLDADLDIKLHTSAHEEASRAQDRAHEHAIADKQAAIAAQSQSADQTHEAQMADQGHAQTLEQQQQAAALAPKPAAEGSND